MTRDLNFDDFAVANLCSLNKILGETWDENELKALWENKDPRGGKLVRHVIVDASEIASSCAQKEAGDGFKESNLMELQPDKDSDGNKISVFLYDDNDRYCFYIDVYHPNLTYSKYE